MQQLLKQSTAATTIVGPILDSTGAAYTSAVIGDLNITKNGTTAAMAAAATLTHDHNGHYLLLFTTGNTDTLGRLDVTCNKLTYAMPPKVFEVLTSSTFDAIVTNAATAAGGLQDVQRINGIAATSVTTISANLGTTQPENFTGTGASALVKVDMIDVNGVAYGSSTLNTLASHDPGATIGTSTLTQTQVTGGAYALNSVSFAFNAALDFTTTQKAATLARVTLTDTATTVTNQLTAAQIATGVWTDTTAADFTTALSIGKSVMNGVSLGTGLTINAYTGNTVQTGDSYARIGATGSGLTTITALLPTALVGGRMDSSIGAVASGVDFSATMKTSITTAATAATPTAAAVTGSVGSIATGGIAAASFASGAIDAAAIATDALGSLELAASAASEIATAVATQITTDHGSGSYQTATGFATPTNITAATGVVLAATGLDSIPTTAPSGVASTFREMVVQGWRRFFRKSTMTATQLKTYADDGTTVLTTQTISDDNTIQTQGTSS